MRGVVKWFDAGKGYGFIARDDGGPDVFTHYTSIDSRQSYKLLVEGDKVDFEINV